MNPDDDMFAPYARERLTIEPFLPDFNHPEEQAFAASLASTRGLVPQMDAMIGDDAAPVVAGFVEVMTPNAFADRHDNVFVIGIHTALFVTIVEFALFAFTQGVFFPMIGDAAGEDSPPPVFGEAPGLFLLDRTLQGGGIDGDTDRHRVPKDADRHVAAIYLALMMARFVWLHEWAHCRRGHVARVKARDETERLNEVPEAPALVGLVRTQTSDDWTRALHAMELEADDMALRLCLAVQVNGLENLPGLLAFDLGTRVTMTVVGAYLMTWLFEEYARHMNTLHAVSHPAPHERLRHVTALIGGLSSPSLDGPALHQDAACHVTALASALPGLARLGF